MIVPDDLARTLLGVHGPSAQAWIARLPAVVAECARSWSLTLEPHFTPLTYNWVAPARQASGCAVVLKIGFPSRELWNEADALALAGGEGMVRLLDVDRERGALLLERLEPGTPLSDLDDEAATPIAAEVMRRLWRPVPAAHDFPSVADWVAGLGRLRRRFGGGTGPLPEDLVARAEALAAELAASAASSVVLHGDLHHGNVLAGRERQWLAIDPKGVVGEPAYEIGALLHNPWPGLLDWPDPAGALDRRLDQLSEGLGIDRARLRAWGLVAAVLSAWWAVDDGATMWDHATRCARILAALPD